MHLTNYSINRNSLFQIIQITLGTLLGHYSVNQVMPFLLLLPVTSVIGGIFFLGESLTTKIALGACLAITGVAMITIQRFPRRRPATTAANNIQPD